MIKHKIKILHEGTEAVNVELSFAWDNVPYTVILKLCEDFDELKSKVRDFEKRELAPDKILEVANKIAAAILRYNFCPTIANIKGQLSRLSAIVRDYHEWAFCLPPSRSERVGGRAIEVPKKILVLHMEKLDDGADYRTALSRVCIMANYKPPRQCQPLERVNYHELYTVKNEATIKKLVQKLGTAEIVALFNYYYAQLPAAPAPKKGNDGQRHRTRKNHGIRPAIRAYSEFYNMPYADVMTMPYIAFDSRMKYVEKYLAEKAREAERQRPKTKK